jgi:hypothetical protein
MKADAFIESIHMYNDIAEKYHLQKELTKALKEYISLLKINNKTSTDMIAYMNVLAKIDEIEVKIKENNKVRIRK